MNLAKQHLDVGLFSTRREEQLAFWQQTVGLPYDHMGKVGGGVQQHRHHMNGSILKMNHSRDPLPEVPPSGIVGLEIAREGLASPQKLTDPDGNRVALVPKGAGGVEGIAIQLKVNDPAAHDRFWTHAMQFERVGEGRYRCGDSLVVVAGRGPVEHRGAQWRGPGYRYMTVQIFDCLAEYAGILARGGTSGGEPRILGETVRYAFVCDPDGNHIEISQRASLTGSL
jgi:predicted enzyme related to lactoylglutathione lyase